MPDSQADREANEWIAAGIRLSVRVEAPCRTVDVSPEPPFLIHLPDFGGAAGMVIDVGHDDWIPSYAERSALARARGLYYSLLGGPGLATDDDTLRATLDDWSYYGTPERKPDWYTGKPWT
jgi:hypothetical protein